MSNKKSIQIRIGVGPNRNNDGGDILQLKTILGALGLYDTPSYGVTPYPDEDIFTSIKKFQSDMGLKVDGIVKPKGETEKALNKKFDIGARSIPLKCRKCFKFHGGLCSAIYCCDCVDNLGIPRDIFEMRNL